jgi:hypothetical protein
MAENVSAGYLYKENTNMEHSNLFYKHNEIQKLPYGFSGFLQNEI